MGGSAGKDGQEMHGYKTVRGNVFTIRKTKGGRTAGKGNLYEDEKCKIKPV